MKAVNRARIVSWLPFGVGHTKPHHYREILKVIWENRDSLPYAWRILRQGVCDGCSLGPAGLRDDTLDGVHLCMTRLKLLRLNTMPGLDPGALADVGRLRRMTGEQLRALGRLPYPMLRCRGEKGFRRILWNEGLELAAEPLRSANPRRLAFYTTSRGLTNEVYYVAQKLCRLLGSNNIDNAARLCHAASTVALKQSIGAGAATCSYTDWIGADLLILFGSDAANNQPVALKYFYYAKQRGARIVVVNPYREPGLENYWIPSVVKSALFGTRLMDDHFPVRVGGDIAFVNGVLKYLIARGYADEKFINEHTTGFGELKSALQRQAWEDLERSSGVSREEMARFAELYGQAKSAVFIWSMGLTQHRFGVQNVKAVVNLALARGMLGRPDCGLVPVRGHSGVQGAAECGAVPFEFPGGFPVDEETARRFTQVWGFPVPSWRGLSAAEIIDAAHQGEMDFLYIVGGNFLETLPEPGYVGEALERVPVRVHQDIFVNSAMLADAAKYVLLLPAQTRYEQRGGGTSTSTERRIRFTPEIHGPKVGEARPEWEILGQVGERALPDPLCSHIHYDSADSIRREMGRVMPLYAGIENLKKEGDSLQWGGPILMKGGVCAKMPDGRARFTPLEPPDNLVGDGCFYLATRRGKQFNTMLFGDRDPLTGSKRRDDVFISPEDAARLGLRQGDPVLVKSEVGEMRGVCRLAPVKAGTLQAFFPEANVLLRRRLDPESGEPDYNAVVTLASL